MKTTLCSWSKAVVCAASAVASCGGPSETSTEAITHAQSAVIPEETIAISPSVAVERAPAPVIGSEMGVAQHLRNGDEFRQSVSQLLRHGRTLFEAVFTPQDGGGRPLSKGTGAPLSDPGSPLIFPRAFNRLSVDANSCGSCHSVPFLGGGGHFTANAFLIGQRFDSLTFDHADTVLLRGALDERGVPVKLRSFNSRGSLGMFGLGVRRNAGAADHVRSARHPRRDAGWRVA